MTVDPTRALARLQQRQRQRQEVVAERCRRLRARIPEAVRLLRDKYGVQRVVLFGSLVHGDPTPDCDVDLAVDGLDIARHIAALADLMQLFGSPVDLVRREEAGPSLLARIEAEGEPQ